MSKCLFAWLYEHCVLLGYSDGMIKSIMEGMGPNTYDLAKYASTFNQETLGVDVEFNDNQSDIYMREMEQELGLDDDSVVVKTHKIWKKMVIIGMADTRTLDLFKGG